MPRVSRCSLLPGSAVLALAGSGLLVLVGSERAAARMLLGRGHCAGDVAFTGRSRPGCRTARLAGRRWSGLAGARCDEASLAC